MLNRQRSTSQSLADLAGAAIFQHLYDPIHVMVDGVIVDCNPAFEKVMGYSRAEMLGTSPARLSPAHQPDGRTSDAAAGTVIGAVMRDGRSRFEWMHQRKDGTPFPVLATLLRANLGGQDAIVTILQDRVSHHHMITQLSAGLSALAQGKVGIQLTETFLPEYETLRSNYNAAADALAQLVDSVVRSAESIHAASREIAEASEDLARRTEGNAASLEQTAAAMSQIETGVKAVAAAADSTSARTDETMKVVGSGRGIVDQAIAAMGSVAESAKGIDSVIEGLDKIAFQTRVLAMNAAVEAGRAGEAGRGFAVVADLVSALAMRSEDEAKRARDQLTVTQVQVSGAVEAVQKVDGALTDIQTDVNKVHELVETMVEDNHAQASSVTEVSSAVVSMDRATQQNAAMVEQTSAAARQLSEEVAALNNQAKRFSVVRKLDAAMLAGARKAGVASMAMH